MPAKNTPTKKTAGPAEKTAAKAAKTPARKSVKKTAQAPQEAALVPEKDLRAMLVGKLLHNFSVQPEEATDENFYNALALGPAGYDAGLLGGIHGQNPGAGLQAGVLSVHGVPHGPVAEKHPV